MLRHANCTLSSELKMTHDNTSHEKSEILKDFETKMFKTKWPINAANQQQEVQTTQNTVTVQT